MNVPTTGQYLVSQTADDAQLDALISKLLAFILCVSWIRRSNALKVKMLQGNIL